MSLNQSIKNFRVAFLYQIARDNLPFILLAAVLFLFISKSLYNIPIGIMALIGLYHAIKSPAELFRDRLTRLFIFVFACIWIPMLFSLPDAVNLSRSAKTVFGYLRFLFMGIYVLQSLKGRDIWQKLRLFIFCLIAFWSIDGLIQLVIGRNLFGYPLFLNRVTGMFYPRYTIAHILAGFSPIYFDYIFEKSRNLRWLWILLIPLVIVVLMCGRRSAWIMLFVSISGYLFYVIHRYRLDKSIVKSLALFGTMILTVAIITFALNKPLQDRVDNTLDLFSGDYEIVNKATSLRLPIWKVSIQMFRDHWINGVGPRGFRYEFDKYSEDLWDGYVPAHPHQMYLEIMVETGLIGIAGFIFAAYWLVSMFLKNRYLWAVFPTLLCSIVVIFPINTHMAIYSSYWGSVVWLILILTFLNARYVQNQDIKKNMKIIS